MVYNIMRVWDFKKSSLSENKQITLCVMETYLQILLFVDVLHFMVTYFISFTIIVDYSC